MIRLIITGVTLAMTLAWAAQYSASSQSPGRCRGGAGQRVQPVPERCQQGTRLRAQDAGRRGQGGGRAIDQTLVVPSQPSFGALASAMIGTPVLDSDGKAVAEVADLSWCRTAAWRSLCCGSVACWALAGSEGRRLRYPRNGAARRQPGLSPPWRPGGAAALRAAGED